MRTTAGLNAFDEKIVLIAGGWLVLSSLVALVVVNKELKGSMRK